MCQAEQLTRQLLYPELSNFKKITQPLQVLNIPTAKDEINKHLENLANKGLGAGEGYILDNN